MGNLAKNGLRSLWKLLCSLKFAVVILIVLTVALIVATFLESAYDTPTAQYWVYRSSWFYVVLFALGLNILCVALSRLPWQPKHIPFLLAHLGILMLLYGSWLTFQFGLDGQMSVGEGTRESQVELPDALLAVAEGESVRTFRVPWIPPHVEFDPIPISDLGLKVARYITHAESKVEFIPAPPGDTEAPALRLRVAGGPKAPPFMKAGQEFWLWWGDPSWNESQVGGAKFVIAQDRDPVLPPQGAAMGFRWDSKKNSLSALIQTSDLKRRKIELGSDSLEGKVIETGWKFEVAVTLQKILPQAISSVTYVPSSVQYGQQAPASAILLEAEGAGGQKAELWLGLGERASLETKGKKVSLGYFPRRKVLPFAVELHRFQIEHYEGTANPMEFSSRVSVHGSGDIPSLGETVISMNEPLKHGGYTFYQASYLPGEPRPTVSVFSVNQDPGRWIKYWGSILLTLGSIALFAVKYRKRKTS